MLAFAFADEMLVLCFYSPINFVRAYPIDNLLIEQPGHSYIHISGDLSFLND